MKLSSISNFHNQEIYPLKSICSVIEARRYVNFGFDQNSWDREIKRDENEFDVNQVESVLYIDRKKGPLFIGLLSLIYLLLPLFVLSSTSRDITAHTILKPRFILKNFFSTWMVIT